MLKTVDELKAFLLWAKSHKIQAVKVGDVEVHFSGTAFIEEDLALPQKGSEERDTSKVLVDELPADDEDILFWSSGQS